MCPTSNITHNTVREAKTEEATGHDLTQNSSKDRGSLREICLLFEASPFKKSSWRLGSCLMYLYPVKNRIAFLRWFMGNLETKWIQILDYWERPRPECLGVCWSLTLILLHKHRDSKGKCISIERLYIYIYICACYGCVIEPHSWQFEGEYLNPIFPPSGNTAKIGLQGLALSPPKKQGYLEMPRLGFVSFDELGVSGVFFWSCPENTIFLVVSGPPIEEQ